MYIIYDGFYDNLLQFFIGENAINQRAIVQGSTILGNVITLVVVVVVKISEGFLEGP